MAEVKRYSLVKPTLNTPFHIDLIGGVRTTRSGGFICAAACPWNISRPLPKRINRRSRLDRSGDGPGPARGGLQHTLINYAATNPDFITTQTSRGRIGLPDLPANGNTALTAAELGERLHRPPHTILRTISGIRTYKGIRVCPDCVS